MIQRTSNSRLVNFRRNIHLLLDKENHINNSIRELSECKNRNFEELKKDLQIKETEIIKLMDEKQQERKKARDALKECSALQIKNSRLQAECEDARFKLQLSEKKNTRLNQELTEMTANSLTTERRYRQQIRKLQQDILRNRLCINPESRPRNQHRSGSAGTDRLGINLSKTFQEQTHISLTEDSFHRK